MAWMIVRDNGFMPDSVDNLAKQRPHIPIIIGTVQDENAQYGSIVDYIFNYARFSLQISIGRQCW